MNSRNLTNEDLEKDLLNVTKQELIVAAEMYFGDDYRSGNKVWENLVYLKKGLDKCTKTTD
jgi:hypothetical protein